jgi:2''-5'' RNA ligase
VNLKPLSSSILNVSAKARLDTIQLYLNLIKHGVELLRRRGDGKAVSEVLRVFVAVDVEDNLLVSRIARVADTLAGIGVPMKIVEPYNLHITLRFIGEVRRGVVEEVARALKEVKFRAFNMTLKGLGAFPSTLNPRVVWIGVSEGYKELSSLREEVERVVRRVGVPAEREEFTPHVTLARVKGTRNIASLTRMLNDMRDYEFGNMVVDKIRLKKSTLTRQGPIYETLVEVKAL